MRILVAPQAGSLGLGGLTRCRAVARAAAMRGHRVAVLCRPEVVSWFSGVAETAFEAPIPKIRGYGAAPNFRLADSIYIRGMDDPDYVETAVANEMSVFATWRPDIVFTENQFTVAVSARVCHIPYVTTAASVNLRGFTSPLYASAPPPPPVERAYICTLNKYKLNAEADVGSIVHDHADLNVAPTLKEIEPALELLPRVVFVGPILDASTELGTLPPCFFDEANRAVVYVYMSAGVLDPEEFLPVLVEVSSVSDHSFWVATLRENVAGRATPFSDGGVHVFDRLPGLAVMKAARVTIVRSGQNALMAAALAGKPVIGFAGHSAEAEFNLRSLSRYREVISEDTGGFNVERLLHLLERVPQVDTCSAYIEFGDRLRAAGGVHATLSAIEAI